MPTLPAPFVHLWGVLRPRLLRPDVRASSIAHIDFSGLKRAGFNAVVVDKDNCVTLPHSDHVFPAYASAWTALLDTFPDRVLVVSNSAGSAKDRGGIGSESLSMSLRAPVLSHIHPKPACTSDILAFFNGKSTPHTRRARIEAPIAAAEASESEAETMLLDKWRVEVEDGPLCGPLRTGPPPTLEEKMVAAQRKKPAPVPKPKPEAVDTSPETMEKPKQSSEAVHIPESLRILVIGDRLFTDILQARQLDKHLSSSVQPSTLAIQTTELPQPNDVRLLRRLEEYLSRGMLANGGRTGGVDWSEYISNPPPAPIPPRWIDVQLDRLNPIKALDDGGPRISLDPRTWRPRALLAAGLRGIAHLTAVVSRALGVGIKRMSVWSWTRLSALARRTWDKVKTHSASRNEVKHGQVDFVHSPKS